MWDSDVLDYINCFHTESSTWRLSWQTVYFVLSKILTNVLVLKMLFCAAIVMHVHNLAATHNNKSLSTHRRGLDTRRTCVSLCVEQGFSRLCWFAANITKKTHTSTMNYTFVLNASFHGAPGRMKPHMFLPLPLKPTLWSRYIFQWDVICPLPASRRAQLKSCWFIFYQLLIACCL